MGFLERGLQSLLGECPEHLLNTVQSWYLELLRTEVPPI